MAYHGIILKLAKLMSQLTSQPSIIPSSRVYHLNKLTINLQEEKQEESKNERHINP